MLPLNQNDPALEEEIRQSIQSGVPIAPELMEYAKSIFPSLQDQQQPIQQETEQADDSIGLEKSPEQMQQQELLQQERYPTSLPIQEDPTAANRKSLGSAIKSAIPKSSPLGQSLKEPEQFEMSPEIKQYGYDLFGMQDVAGDAKQELPMAQKEPVQAAEEDNLEDEEMLSDEELLDQIVVDGDTFKKRNPDFDVNNLGKKLKAPTEMPAEAPIEDMGREPASTNLKNTLPPEEDTSVDEMVKKYREQEDRADYFKSLAKFRDAVMGAGSGRVLTGTDYSTYDEMKARAKRPIEDVMLKTQLTDNKAKSDPNSQISQLMRKTLGNLGIDMADLSEVSYSQLEKIYPSLANTIATKIAADAKKEQASQAADLRREAEAARKSEKEIAKQDRRLSELNKRTENVLKSDEYKLYNNIGTTNALINEAIQMWKDGDDSYKQTTQSAFMGFAKAAQQDSSVVRESDMRVLAGGVNYGSLGGLLQKIVAKGKGADYSPEELQGFKKAVEIIRDVKRQDLQKRFNPILSRATDADISPDYLVSSDLLDDIYSKPKQPEKDPLQQKLEEVEAKLKANQSRIEVLRNKRSQ